MKKTFAWALALILCLCAMPGLGDEAGPSPLGEWYALQNGLAVTLTLREDGTYLYDLPALPGEMEEGEWELTDGFIRMDGDDDLALFFTGDTLFSNPLELFFSREPVEGYVPPDPIPDALPEDMNGYWRSVYVITDGALLPAGLLQEDTELYIEAPLAALGGSMFGDVIVEFAQEEGALIHTGEGFALTLQLQRDGLLRLTFAAPDADITLILIRADAPGLLSLTPEE